MRQAQQRQYQPRSEHYETKLRSPHDRFSAAIRIELCENRGDVKFGSVEGDSHLTCDRFVGGTVCHRSKDFELAGRQPRAGRIVAVEYLISKRG